MRQPKFKVGQKVRMTVSLLGFLERAYVGREDVITSINDADEEPKSSHGHLYNFEVGGILPACWEEQLELVGN